MKIQILNKILSTSHYSPFTKKSFTLAEVLITLGIISIVAEITIPTLMQNVQDAQFKTTWEKTYSTLNQAYSKYLYDNNMTLSYGVWNSNADLKNAFKPYFSYVQECSGNIFGTCWNSIGALHKITLAQNPQASWWADYKDAAVLKDGTSLIFSVDAAYLCVGPNTSLGECGRIYVDVNGVKGPNVWGRDIYGLLIYPNKILPAGSPVISNASSNADCYTGSGMYCSYAYLIGN